MIPQISVCRNTNCSLHTTCVSKHSLYAAQPLFFAFNADFRLVVEQRT